MTQNEYSIWKQQDRHSRAYATLTTAESARIARNLGIADPTGADICLDCHADNVAPAVRGPSFDIAEG
ncbi:MAG: multiheme c-type cytochrome, partial [Rhodospirillaceae bacterium]